MVWQKRDKWEWKTYVPTYYLEIWRFFSKEWYSEIFILFMQFSFIKACDFRLKWHDTAAAPGSLFIVVTQLCNNNTKNAKREEDQCQFIYKQ